MSKLLEETIRLAAEIHGGRIKRSHYVHSLQQGEVARKQRHIQARHDQSRGREQQARDSLAERQEYVRRLGSKVAAVREQSANHLAQIRQELSQKAASAAADRVSFVANIKYQTAVMREGHKEKLRKEAQQGYAERSQAMSKIRTELQTLFAPIRGELERSTQEIASKTAAILSEARAAQERNRQFHSSLTQKRSETTAVFVSNLRRDVGEMLGNVRAEMEIARNVLADPAFLADLLEKRGQSSEQLQSGDPAESTTQEQRSVVEKSSAPAEESVASQDVDISVKKHGPDDLTVIQGIGPGVAKRLVDAGIDSYIGLATATEETLREAVGKKMPGMASWISQSRELVGLD